MFFIMGISNGEKKLNFDQLEVCNGCGTSCEIDAQMGKEIERGKLTHLSMQDLHFEQRRSTF